MAAVAAQSDLMGIGFSAPQAQVLGDTSATVAGVGTTQVGAAAIATSIVVGTTAASQTAFVLPANWPNLSAIFFTNTSATSALVFPPSGGQIDLGGANTSVTVAQNKSRIFIRISTNVWVSLAGA